MIEIIANPSIINEKTKYEFKIHKMMHNNYNLLMCNITYIKW